MYPPLGLLLGGLVTDDTAVGGRRLRFGIEVDGDAATGAARSGPAFAGAGEDLGDGGGRGAAR